MGSQLEYYYQPQSMDFAGSEDEMSEYSNCYNNYQQRQQVDTNDFPTTQQSNFL